MAFSPQSGCSRASTPQNLRSRVHIVKTLKRIANDSSMNRPRYSESSEDQTPSDNAFGENSNLNDDISNDSANSTSEESIVYRKSSTTQNNMADCYGGTSRKQTNKLIIPLLSWQARNKCAKYRGKATLGRRLSIRHPGELSAAYEYPRLQKSFKQGTSASARSKALGGRSKRPCKSSAKACTSSKTSRALKKNLTAQINPLDVIDEELDQYLWDDDWATSYQTNDKNNAWDDEESDEEEDDEKGGKDKDDTDKGKAKSSVTKEQPPTTEEERLPLLQPIAWNSPDIRRRVLSLKAANACVISRMMQLMKTGKRPPENPKPGGVWHKSQALTRITEENIRLIRAMVGMDDSAFLQECRDTYAFGRSTAVATQLFPSPWKDYQTDRTAEKIVKRTANLYYKQLEYDNLEEHRKKLPPKGLNRDSIKMKRMRAMYQRTVPRPGTREPKMSPSKEREAVRARVKKRWTNAFRASIGKPKLPD